MGYIVPQPAANKTGKSVAIIGSGPAGLAAAQQLARAGHMVDVYERESRPGGLLRYGIPDFKMEKHLIDRRIAQMEGEGVRFLCGVNIGVDKPLRGLLDTYDAVLYSGGSETPRPAGIPGLIWKACMMPCLIWCSRTAGWAAKISNPSPGLRLLFWLAASTSWWSAAAIRLRIAWAPRFVRARSTSPSSTFARSPGKGRQAQRLALLGDQDAHFLQPGGRCIA